MKYATNGYLLGMTRVVCSFVDIVQEQGKNEIIEKDYIFETQSRTRRNKENPKPKAINSQSIQVPKTFRGVVHTVNPSWSQYGYLLWVQGCWLGWLRRLKWNSKRVSAHGIKNEHDKGGTFRGHPPMRQAD